MLTIVGGDIETTGTDQASGDQIIEIALSIYQTADAVNFIKKTKTYLRRCLPTVAIAKGAFNVHGISLADLKGAPSWNVLAPEVSKLLSYADLFVAHNVAFDAPFIAGELARVGAKVPNFDVFCTMENGRTATALGKLPRLEELCWAYGVEYDADAAHAADYDIEKTMQCFFSGVQHGHFVVPSFEKLKEKRAA